MSREFIFYPAFREEKTGKYRPLIFNVNGEPESIFWRSGSFIDADYFANELPMVKTDDFHDSCKKYFGGRFDDFPGDNDLTYVYIMSQDLLSRVGFNGGIITGYALLDEMKAYYASDCPQEYMTWEMSNIIPAEVYAEMPVEEQKKYGRFSTVDYYSKEYVCSILSEVLDDIYVPYEWEGERCILMVYSF